MAEERISFDRVSEVYDTTRAMPAEMMEAVIDGLVDIGGIMPYSRVLELGVGTGRIAAPLSAASQSRYYGVDVSLKMMKKIREKDGKEVTPIAADVCSLPFKAGYFDVVLAIHVFHLVPDWECAAREAVRVLDPNGVIIVGGEGAGRGSPLQNLTSGMKEGLRKEVESIAEDVGITDTRVGMKSLDEAAGIFTNLGGSVIFYPPVEHVMELPLFLLLELVRGRTFQFLWEISDDTLSAALDRLEKLFKKHYGSLDEKVSLNRRFDFLRAAF